MKDAIRPAHSKTAAHAPRSLNVPDGLRPSSFMTSCGLPSALPSAGVCTIGVQPSPSVAALSGSSTGKSGQYRQSELGQCDNLSRSNSFASRLKS